MNVNTSLRAATLAVVCLAVGFGLGKREGLGARAGDIAETEVHPLAAATDSYQFFDTLVDLRSQILHNYVEKVDDEKLMNGAIRGMMAELDPYSNYFTKNELANFDRAVHGQFLGVGIEIAQDTTTGNFIIVSPLEDSPALKAGIFAGDRILKVNGESVENMAQKDLIAKVSGEPNTELKLTIVHEGEKTPLDVAIMRTVIQVHSVRGVKLDSNGNWSYLIDPEHRVGYVRITNFMENTADELDKAMLPLINDKEGGSLKGIILDLRFDPGGLLQAGIDVSKRFLDAGVIVSAGRPDSTKRDMVVEATKEKTYPRIPLVVLINEYSASASEIVAGALKDHKRAVVVGARSFGKGSVQSLINLDNGNAALKLTTQYYYLPSGKNIMRKKDATEWGVEPDTAFNIPLTKEENQAVLIARSRSEIIHKTAATVPAAAGAGGELMGAAGSGGATASAPATRGAEPADRQLQRAVEILVAYQAFGPTREFTADVTTTRPVVSVSVPATNTAPQPSTQQDNREPATPADVPR